VGHTYVVSVADQTSRVPALDARAMERLAAAVDRPEVVAAFLIGSQARGSAGPLSDVDVAILHVPGLASEERLELRLSLGSSAGAALGTPEVDIVLLNDAPPLLRHRSLRDGVRLVDHSPKERIDFEVRTLNDYVDTEPLRRLVSGRLRKSIAEDGFGRRA
jgi:predicted nucleotidyltransferase